MHTNRIINLVFITIIATLLVLMYGCGEKKAQATQTLNEKKGALQVKTAKVDLQDFQDVVDASGTLVPQHHTKLTALVRGNLDSLNTDIGDKVKKGDILFQVRTVDYDLTLKKAEAGLERAEIMVKDKRREMKRVENLYKEGSTTQQAFDKAVTASEEAASDLKLRVAARDTARQALKDCTITAPYNGVITAKYIQEGEFVQPGIPVLEIMDLTTLNAEIDVSERYAGKIIPGTTVTISASAGTKPVAGNITAINPKIDLSNRTFLVKVSVDNTDGTLQAGLFCTAQFKLPVSAGQASIPACALSRDRGKSNVWVIEDDKAHQIEVADNGIYNGRVWIRSGLHKGQQVVIEGAINLTEGVEVSVVQ